MRRLFVLLMLSCSALAQPLPLTPDVLINRKVTLAEVGEKGRVYVDFDMRPIGGVGTEVRLFRPGQRPDEDLPFRKWTFGAFGHERLDFNDLPRAIYRVVGVALGPDGRPMSQPSRLVTVEYGGWRAWQGYQPSPNRDLRAPGPPFESLQVGESREAPGLQVTPATLVLNPNEKGELKAEFLNPEMAGEEVEWELFGVGDLEARGASAFYKAPDEALNGANQIVQVRVRIKARPMVRAQASILLTEMKKEELK